MARYDPPEGYFAGKRLKVQGLHEPFYVSYLGETLYGEAVVEGEKTGRVMTLEYRLFIK